MHQKKPAGLSDKPAGRFLIEELNCRLDHVISKQIIEKSDVGLFFVFLSGIACEQAIDAVGIDAEFRCPGWDR